MPSAEPTHSQHSGDTGLAGQPVGLEYSPDCFLEPSECDPHSCHEQRTRNNPELAYCSIFELAFSVSAGITPGWRDRARKTGKTFLLPRRESNESSEWQHCTRPGSKSSVDYA